VQQSDQCEKWLKVAANLRVDRKDNIAPHKPLLLLVIAELAEHGKLEPILPLTGELVFRFLAFWTVVANRRSQKPNIRLPFYHMRSDGCWTPLDEKGEPTLERLRVAAAQFDETFLACLHDPAFRKQLRRVLIARYFTDPGERAALYDLVGLPVPPDDVVKADAKRYEEARERGREARFRLTVVPAYNYTCALIGYRCVTVDAGSIVDAAHIHQFADSRNNHPQNGLALSKNAHWMFDAGLWSLDNDYRVIVAASRFDEAGAAAFLLKRKAGQQVHLPGKRDYWPNKADLAWHRHHKFAAATVSLLRQDHAVTVGSPR
jgi:putative restriction endonuclease